MTLDGMFQLLMTGEFGSYAMSLDQTIVFWNQGAERILGYSADQVIGRRCYEVKSGLDPGGFTPECQNGCPSIRALRAGQIPQAMSLQMMCASGEEKPVSLTPMVVSDAASDAPLLVYLLDDSSATESSAPIADSEPEELSRSTARTVSDHAVVISDPTGAGKLTRRELEVLRLVALGWDTARIAEELGVSVHTALNHIRNFRQKLDAQNKLEAVVTAVRLGILEWK